MGHALKVRTCMCKPYARRVGSRQRIHKFSTLMKGRLPALKALKLNYSQTNSCFKSPSRFIYSCLTPVVPGHKPLLQDLNNEI